MNTRILALVISTPLLAQTDLQTRLIIHPTVDLGGAALCGEVLRGWFLTGWSITNLRTETPNNTNLFGGLGYRGKNWWAEGMTHRQWRPQGGRDWMVDVRFQKQFAGRRAVSLYVESEFFLTRRAFYEFVIAEARILPVEKSRWFERWRIGGETENVHRAEARDSLALGARLTYPLGTFREWTLSSSLAYRVQSPEPNAFRFYLSVSRRFQKH